MVAAFRVIMRAGNDFTSEYVKGSDVVVKETKDIRSMQTAYPRVDIL